MDLLTGIGAANGLLQSTASFVRSLKEPRLTDEAFSDIFRRQLAATTGPEALEARALQSAQRARSRGPRAVKYWAP